MYSLINKLIDAFEQKHGPVEDRSIFSGDIVVPPHLRNISLVNTRPNRLHGSLFGSLSRSRTFLSLSPNSRQSFCGSVPDLSRNSIGNCHGSDSASNSIAPLAVAGGFSHPGSPTMNDSNRQTMPSIRPLLTKSDGIEFRAKSHYERPMVSPLYGNGRGDCIHDMNVINRLTASPPDSKGYMALIRTNNTNSLPNRHSGSAMRSLSARYGDDGDDSVAGNDEFISPTSPSLSMSSGAHLSPFYQQHCNFSMAFGNELSLDNLTKYTIPRVSLRHNSVTSPLVSPNSQRKFSNYNNDANALKKESKIKYEDDVSAA